MRIESLLLKAVALAEFLLRYFHELALQQFASVAIIILGLLVRWWVLFVLLGLKMRFRVSEDLKIDRGSLLLPFMLR